MEDTDKFPDMTVCRGNDPIFGIEDWYFLGRKKPVLWVQTAPNARVKVASFNNWEAARIFRDVIEKMLGKGGDGDD